MVNFPFRAFPDVGPLAGIYTYKNIFICSQMRSETAFRALADPTRLRILRLLGSMELAVGEIAQVLGKSHDAVRKAQSRTMAALKAAAASTPGFPNEAHHG